MKPSQLKLLVCILLTILTLTIFWRVQNHDFLNFDDNLYILDNHNVNSGLNVENISWSFKTIHGGFWFPLTWLSHMLDCEIYGLNPAGHHFNNLLFHIINTILLFLVLNKLSGELLKSAFVAMLFAIHPLHVEPVAWIASRKDVLSTMFWILVIFFYCNYTVKPNLKRYLLVIAFFILGLMSKPMLVTLPFVLLLLDYWPIERWPLGRRRDVPRYQSDSTAVTGKKNLTLATLVIDKLPLIALGISAALFVFYTEKTAGALPTFEACPLNIRFANATVSYSSYILKMFWPSHLSVYYPLLGMPPWWQIVSSAAVIALISFLSIRYRFKLPYLLVGWLWYLISLLPVIGIVQIGSHSMADRYTYVPLIGLFIMITWLVGDLINKLKIPKLIYITALVLLSSALSICSLVQAGYWKNGITLFGHAINVTRDNHLMYYNMGYEMFKKGDTEAAIRFFSQAVNIKPDYFQAHNNLGVALAAQGREDEAVTHFMDAIKSNPDYIEAYNNLAGALKDQGKNDDALSQLLIAEEIQPDNPEIHYGMGVIYAKKGEYNKAIFHFDKATTIKHGYAEAYNNMGFSYAKNGDLDKAVQYLLIAIEYKKDYAEAYYNLGIVLSMQGKLTEAKKLYQKAIQLKPDYMEARSNLQNIVNDSERTVISKGDQ